MCVCVCVCECNCYLQEKLSLNHFICDLSFFFGAPLLALTTCLYHQTSRRSNASTVLASVSKSGDKQFVTKIDDKWQRTKSLHSDFPLSPSPATQSFGVDLLGSFEAIAGLLDCVFNVLFASFYIRTQVLILLIFI